MAEATFAAIIGGLISGCVVLTGVLLAEWLRRSHLRRQRIFELRLNEREVLDEFFATLNSDLEGQGEETERAADRVQAMTCELEAELRRGVLPAWGKRAARAEAVNRFVLMFAAARVRLLVSHGALRPREVDALKTAMVDYENRWGATSEQDRRIVMHYLEHGIDGGPPAS